jgi:hypothetical protein
MCFDPPGEARQEVCDDEQIGLFSEALSAFSPQRAPSPHRDIPDHLKLTPLFVQKRWALRSIAL